MKKITLLALLLTLLLAFSACGEEQKETESQPESSAQSTETSEETTAPEETGVFRVGFSRANCMPDDPVPLAGYGNVDKRISTGFLDYLTISCTVVTDENGNTIVLYSSDTTGANWCDELIEETAKRFNVPKDHVFQTSTHTHSAPSLGSAGFESINKYKAKLIDAGLQVCEEAFADRRASSMAYNEVDLKGYNFIRHYLLSDGTYIGDNFGSKGDGVEYVDHATEENTIMSIVKFQREDAKDIYLANWRVHPHITGGSSKYNISADIWAIIRQTVEKESDCHFVYYNGDAGNSNPCSRMASDSVAGVTYTGSDRDYKVYGKEVGALINSCIKQTDWQAMELGPVKVMAVDFTANVNHLDDSKVDLARQINAVWTETGNSSDAMKLAGDSGIRSVYHASSIISKVNKGVIQTQPIWVAQIGELGITFAPNELFVENGNFVRENSPYKFQMVFGYTNKSFSYIPSQHGYDYYCYETCVGSYEPGTGEILASRFVELLTELKNQ